MKKLLILIGAAVLLFGCTGPMGPQGPQGPQEEGSQTFTLTYKLASADWEKGTATVTLSAPVDREILKKAVADGGYTVTEIREEEA